jgi:ribonuclease HII
VIKGDNTYVSIAAASILAKVARDEHMEGLVASYPAYGWEKNAGYGTAQHFAALKEHGLTPLHRKSFLKNM